MEIDSVDNLYYQSKDITSTTASATPTNAEPDELGTAEEIPLPMDMHVCENGEESVGDGILRATSNPRPLGQLAPKEADTFIKITKTPRLMSLNGKKSGVSGVNVNPVRTPRPVPIMFSENNHSFIGKKPDTPCHCIPPKPPAKSAPPLSRVFQVMDSPSPRIVSFNKPSSLSSKFYREDSEKTYLDQCFIVRHRLGYGSFGEVYSTKSCDDKQNYAVKRTREKFRCDSERKRRCREVSKLEQMSHHPNCVNFEKAWQENGLLYIQTELCCYSLEQFYSMAESIPEKLVKNYLVDLLMAIRYVHKKDIIHMDIKPENLLITEDDVCKLGDFGLSIDINYEEDLDAVEGDPRYMARELLDGVVSKSVDIYSIGMSLLELGGINLAKSGTPWHVLRSKEFNVNDYVKDFSQELRDIIIEMTDENPQNRPTAEELLARPFLRNVVKRRKALHPLCVNNNNKKRTPSIADDDNEDSTELKDSFLELDESAIDDESDDDDSEQMQHAVAVRNELINLFHALNEDAEDPAPDSSDGVPLSCSTSGEESDDFSCKNQPVQHAFTTPARPRHRHAPPILDPSPVARPELLFNTDATPKSSMRYMFCSSPVNTGPAAIQKVLRFEENDCTPNSSFELEDENEDNMDVAEAVNIQPKNQDPNRRIPMKLGIAPKNLLSAFEFASEEDQALERAMEDIEGSEL